MDFDLVARKIGAKLLNLVIYGDILVNILRNLSSKSIVTHKIKMAIIRKLLPFLVTYLGQFSKSFEDKIDHNSKDKNRKVVLS